MLLLATIWYTNWIVMKFVKTGSVIWSGDVLLTYFHFIMNHGDEVVNTKQHFYSLSSFCDLAILEFKNVTNNDDEVDFWGYSPKFKSLDSAQCYPCQKRCFGDNPPLITCKSFQSFRFPYETLIWNPWFILGLVYMYLKEYETDP